MGLGYHKKKLGSVRAWARNRCQYLDEQTFYRTLPEIHRLFHRYFGQLRQWEASYARATPAAPGACCGCCRMPYWCQ